MIARTCLVIFILASVTGAGCQTNSKTQSMEARVSYVDTLQRSLSAYKEYGNDLKKSVADANTKLTEQLSKFNRQIVSFTVIPEEYNAANEAIFHPDEKCEVGGGCDEGG